ncbi:MAG TPA: ABC transporter ATP-binding protein, partial [Polyangiaceae bacterium]
GPNGAGKTTLLLMLLGVRRPRSGRIVVGGTTLLDTARRLEVPVESRRLGYVPQDYALFPHMTALANIEFALANGDSNQNAASRRLKALSLLSDFGLAELAQRRSTELSGGEKQRVALARALAPQPRALLLDEPLSALDASARKDVRSFLASHLKRLGLPALVVTHDPADARELGHRIAVLEAGSVVQVGTWAELCARPASPFVERFVA